MPFLDIRGRRYLADAEWRAGEYAIGIRVQPYWVNSFGVRWFYIEVRLAVFVLSVGFSKDRAYGDIL